MYLTTHGEGISWHCHYQSHNGPAELWWNIFFYNKPRAAPLLEFVVLHWQVCSAIGNPRLHHILNSLWMFDAAVRIRLYLLLLYNYIVFRLIATKSVDLIRAWWIYTRSMLEQVRISSLDMTTFMLLFLQMSTCTRMPNRIDDHAKALLGTMGFTCDFTGTRN